MLSSYTGISFLPSFPFSFSSPLPVFLFPLLLPSLCLCVSLSDLKDFQNNKHRYLLASENQRPGNFSTASMGSLTASPSSCSLSSQVGLTSVSSIQERIMSTPGGEEAIERLKVGIKEVTESWTRENLLSQIAPGSVEIVWNPLNCSGLETGSMHHLSCQDYLGLIVAWSCN